MERDLQRISTMTGAGCAFVCDNGGSVVATSDPPALATATMSQIGRVATQVFQAMSAASRPADRAEFVYDTWRLFARDLGPAVVLVVLGPGADMPLVRMSIDATVVGWKADKEIQRRLARSTARRDQVAPRELDGHALRSWRAFAARG